MKKILYHSSPFIVFYIIIILLGVYSFAQLKIQLTPDIRNSNIYVSIDYPGSKAELVENLVTKPMEEILSNTDGLISMTTFSESNQSKIKLNIRSKINIDNAINHVRDLISKNKSLLPDEIKSPIVSKNNFLDKPMLYVSVKVNSEKDILHSVINEIKQQLKYIDGYAKTSVIGNQDKALYINLFLDKVLKYNISLGQLLKDIIGSNAELTGGKKSDNYITEYISFKKQINNFPDFFNLLVKDDMNIKLKDIAGIKLIDKPVVSHAYVNGDKVALLGLFVKSGFNPVNYYNNISNFLERYMHDNPNVKLKIVINHSNDISKSFNNTIFSLIETTISVSIIILIVIGRIRYGLIALLSIPIAISGCGIILYLFGYTINNISMLAIILAIGLVVDDSIIVIEKIDHYHKSGHDIFISIFRTISELFISILILMMILIVVYIPCFFINGEVGDILREFSVTIVSCIVLSFFTSFTITPVLFLKAATKHRINVNSIRRKIDLFFKKILYVYIYTLIKVIRNIKVFTLSILILSISILIIISGKEKVDIEPFEKRDMIIIEDAFAPNTSLDYIHHYMQKIFNIIKNDSNVSSVISLEESPISTFFLNLKDQSKANKTLEEINRILSNITVGGNITTWISQSKNVTNISNKYKLHFYISNPKSKKSLYAASKYINDNMSNVFENFYTISPAKSQNIGIKCNTDKLSKYGLRQSEFAEILDIFLNQRKLKTFEYQKNSYDIIVKLDDSSVKDIGDIESISLKDNRNKFDRKIQLRDVCSIYKTLEPSQIFKFNEQFALEGYAITKAGVSLNEAISLIRKINNNLQNGSNITFSETTQNLIDLAEFYFLFMLFAVCGLYLLIYARFNNLLLPIAVLGNIPICLSFSLLCLYLIGGTFNIYTTLALLTLVGLITKHSFLLCNAIYQYQQAGFSIGKAVLLGSRSRIRAIFITSIIIIISLVLLLFDTGNYANSKYQLAVVLLSGMSVGSLLTIYISPSLYILLDFFYKKFYFINKDEKNQ